MKKIAAITLTAMKRRLWLALGLANVWLASVSHLDLSLTTSAGGVLGTFFIAWALIGDDS